MNVEKFKKIIIVLQIVILFIPAILFSDDSSIIKKFIADKHQKDIWLNDHTFLLKATGYYELHCTTPDLMKEKAFSYAGLIALEKLADIDFYTSKWDHRPQGLIDACRNGTIIHVHDYKWKVVIVYRVTLKNLKKISEEYYKNRLKKNIYHDNTIDD